jgi:hypothetical protein
MLALLGCSSDGADAGAAPTAALGPLDEYLSGAFGSNLSPDEQRAELDRQRIRREELIAQCMTDEGFEYTPDTGGQTFFVSSDDANIDFRPDDRDWVAEFGYGIINNPFSFSAEAPPDGGGAAPVDSNQEYLDSLSEAEREAYLTALLGEARDDGPQTTVGGVAGAGAGVSFGSSDEYDWQTAGCHGWADHEVQATNPATSDEFAPLMAAIDEFYATGFGADPAAAELNLAWSFCMADAGYPGYDSQSEPSARFFEEYVAPIVNTWDFEANHGGPETSEEYQALATKEIDLALADLDCREETDFTNRMRAISFAAQQRFVDDHHGELEAFKAAVEQNQGN